MSLSDRPGAYADCFKLFDAAIDTPAGVRMPVSLSESDARYFQMRMNQARVVLRAESRRIYPPENRLYNTSEYDGLAVRLRQSPDSGIWYIYVEPVGNPALLNFIEPLGSPALPSPSSHPQLSGPANASDSEDLE